MFFFKVLVSPCDKDKNGQIRLSQSIGNGTSFSFPSALLKTFVTDTTIVAKGMNVSTSCFLFG